MRNQQVSPRLITLARQSRKLTQKELAQLVGIEQGALSKIEKGFNNATHSTLKSISSALNYPISFFQRPGRLNTLRTPFHRSKRALNMKEREQIEATASIQTDCVETLLEQVDSQINIPFIRPDDDQNTPDNIAFKVRKVLGLGPGPVPNLTEAMESNGVFIVRRDFGTDLVDGFTLVSQGGAPIVFVSSRISGDRLRWTLAHELGHIVMHEFPMENCEEEANSFASAFLMPPSEIYSSIDDLNFGDLPDLKRFWKVSMAAIIVWAYKIGAITNSRYRYLWTQLSKAGYRKREPRYLEIPIEIPSLLDGLVNFHIKDLGYSLEQVSELLCISFEDFDEWFACPGAQNVIPFDSDRFGVFA